MALMHSFANSLLLVIVSCAGSLTAFAPSTIRVLPRTIHANLQLSADPFGTVSLTSQAFTSPSTLTSEVDLSNLKPAVEHSQPFWGAPDPYLTAGHSIAPTAKALANAGIERVSVANWDPELVELYRKGTKVLDSAQIQAQSVMPGFTPTGGILPYHNAGVPAETPATFAAQVEWSANFMNVVDKIPEVVFAYALIEFFILRPNLDTYKEDIEESSGRAFAETIAVSGVRFGMFALIAIVTSTVFG